MDAWSVASWLLLALLAVAALLFLLFCVMVQYSHMKFDHIPGPPRDSFFFGHYPSLRKSMNNDGLIHEQFLQWTEKYGRVLRINILHNASLIVSSPEAIKEFLMSPQYKKDKMVYERMFGIFGERCLGKGLVTATDNDRWHKQRRVMDPAFSRTYLMGLMGTFNEKAELLMENLAEFADGKTEVKIHDLMSRLTLDVIAKVAFGLDINSLQDDQTPFPKAISMLMKGLTSTREPFIRLYPGKQKFVKDVQESIRLLRRTGKECIKQRQKAIDNGDEIPMDILTQILKGAALEDDCDEEIMLDNFVTFFLAGQETTANQLAFAVMLLSRAPQVLEKVQAEVDDIIGSKRDLEFDDLGKLQYLTQVLKETLRLYPTAPGTSRQVEKDTVIEGLKIPAEVVLIFNMYVVGRLEEFYKDPLIFNPDRFSPDAPKPYYTYFPFSLGPRSCIGQIFAQMEAKVVMAKLLQRYDFELVAGQSFKIMDTGSLRPRDGVICRITPRTNPKGFK
ncbi:cholesterol 24-hydroxylase-like [Ambystoma mexicanum]|uniref:cholesterol 24-hydroxylase-like n=1 Tax=Ambystoma mexicanum TaxID=8296 RepID=UPI0037E8FC6A